jgi:hypothetical protein
MHKLLPATVATLLLVSCSNGPGTSTSAGTEQGAGRDLSLASQASAEPLVLSAVERQSMTRPASQGRGKARLVTEVRTAVPRPTGTETIATAIELAPAAAPEVLPDAPATPPVETPVATAGAGHSLAPGQTVASIPAAGMGSGDPPAIQTIARGGTGFLVRRPDDNCAPHGGVIAVHRVYPSQPGFRRF